MTMFPRTTIPDSMPRTQRGQTGNWGSGPGNNISNTMNGLNVAEHTIFQKIGVRVDTHFKKKTKQRKQDKEMRRQAHWAKFGKP